MPRIQVYLPDDLYAFIKLHALSPSELLQAAVREKAARQQLLAEGDKYFEELISRVGMPTAAEIRRVAASVKRVAPPSRKRAG